MDVTDYRIIEILQKDGRISMKDLGKIVGLSTMECYGVVGMVSKNATEGLWELMRIENLSKGVKLKFNDEDKLIIELSIIFCTFSQQLLLNCI